MNSEGRDFHAQSNRPVGTTRLLFCCKKCGRKWVSWDPACLNGDRLMFSTITKRCYGCNEKVAAVEYQPPQNFTLQSVEKREFLVYTCGEMSKSRMFAKEAILDIPVLFDSGAEVSVIAAKCSGDIQTLQPISASNLK